MESKKEIISFVGAPCTGKTACYNSVKNHLKNEKGLTFVDEPASALMKEFYAGRRIEELTDKEYSGLQYSIFETWVRILSNVKNEIIVSDTSPLENTFVYLRRVADVGEFHPIENIYRDMMKHFNLNLLYFTEPMPYEDNKLRHGEAMITKLGEDIEDVVYKENVPFHDMPVFSKQAGRNIAKRTEDAIQRILAVRNLSLNGHHK